MGAPALYPFDDPEDIESGQAEPHVANSDLPNYGNTTRAWFDGSELAAHLEAGRRAERRRMILAVVASAAVVVSTIILLSLIG